VGNLAVGGTGKTPMVRFLIQKMMDEGIFVAVLSRGYGRKSKGLVHYQKGMQASDIGDEPFELALSYPNVEIIVSEQRKNGLLFIQEHLPSVKVVILDDALQHRRVRLHYYFLLTTYSNPFYQDTYLPAGQLRDHKSRAKDADAIVVTKTPDSLGAEERVKHVIRNKMLPNQCLLFSDMEYEALVPIMNEPNKQVEQVILVSGIADAFALKEYVKKQFTLLQHFEYPDHHPFDPGEIEVWKAFLANYPNCALITTAKDWARMQSMKSRLENTAVYVLPIKPVFLPDSSGIDQELKGIYTKVRAKGYL
jgi:tetraacyldisaccharide 4'-kinase